MQAVIDLDALVDRVMEISAGDLGSVASWLEGLGMRVARHEEGGRLVRITAQGLTGMNVGLVNGTDPATTAAQLGFALYGMIWPIALPGFMTKVGKRWRELMRERRAERGK